MNSHENSIAPRQTLDLSRRAFLGASLAATLPPAAAVASLDNATVSVGDFLAGASLAEKARYHADALAEIFCEMFPEEAGFRVQIDAGAKFAFVRPDFRGPAPSNSISEASS